MKLNSKKMLAIFVITAGLFITKQVKAQGMSFSDALKKATLGKLISVTISTTQDNGIVSYITGGLGASGSKALKAPLTGENAFGGTGPLIFLSSDRIKSYTYGKPGSLSITYLQPFRYDKADSVGLSIEQDANGSITATFTLISWGNTKYTVDLQAKGDLLYGLGAPVGNKAKQALYVITFTGVTDQFKNPQ